MLKLSNLSLHSTILSLLVFAGPSAAADLDAAALTAVTTGKMWTVPSTLAGGAKTSWDWNADGKVCLRLMGSTSGECADEGTWKIVDNRLCYQLTWWMKSIGAMSGCLVIQALGDHKYEATYPSGTRIFKGFSVHPS